MLRRRGQAEAEQTDEHADDVERKPTPEVIQTRKTLRMGEDPSQNGHNSDNPEEEEPPSHNSQYGFHSSPPSLIFYPIA